MNDRQVFAMPISPHDSTPAFGEEKDMSADTQEKAPGVYVRDDEQEQPHELDMLWSNPRSYHRDDRSPIIAFIAGLLVGTVLTSAVFLLLVMRPNVKTDADKTIIP